MHAYMYVVGNITNIGMQKMDYTDVAHPVSFKHCFKHCKRVQLQQGNLHLQYCMCRFVVVVVVVVDNVYDSNNWLILQGPSFI